MSLPSVLPSRYFWVAGIAAPAVLVVPATAIAAKHYLTIEQAQKVMFPQAEQFSAISMTPSASEVVEIEKLADSRTDEWLIRIWRVEERGKLVGYFAVDDVIGKHDYITYAVSLSLAGEIRALELLEYRETKGGEIEQLSWREQFKGKTVDSPIQIGGDIANISGATLSCKHVAAGVKRILAAVQLLGRR